MRTYKRRVGARSYVNYSEATLEEALIEIVEGRMSQAEASRRYKIPLGTINNKYKGRHMRKAGGQTTLTKQEEKKIVESIKLCGDWGFPLAYLDIRLMTKQYLQAVGKKPRYRTVLKDLITFTEN